MAQGESVRRKGSLMTEGSIPGHIFSFAMPLLLGNLFQQFYSAVDSAIVGRFVGKEALAAVGSSTSLIFLIVSLFMGIAIGGSVCVSQYYGAGDDEGVHHAVHTIFAFSLAAGSAMSVLGIFLSRFLLRLMGTPADVIGLSSLYFSIFFGGSLALVFYNMGSGLLRAIGDSRRPMIYLIVSTVSNIILDLLFVAVFKWGIAGAALATVVSEALSAVLVIRVLMKTTESYKVILKDIRFYKRQLKNIVQVGLPSGIQNSVVSLSNVVVQSSINSFGTIAVAGCGAYMKIDGFVLLPAMSFSMALTTFVGQNIGAGRHDRVRQGLKVGTLMSLGTSLIIILILQFATRPLLSIFSSDPEVVGVGMMMMHVVSTGYLMVAASHALAGVLRGAGLTKVPMFVMIGCWCILRMTWILAVARPLGSLKLVLAGYPITWAASMILILIYLKKADWINYYERSLK